MATATPENTVPPGDSPVPDTTAASAVPQIPVPASAVPQTATPEVLVDVDDDDSDLIPLAAAVPSLAARLGAEALGSFLFVFASLGIAMYTAVSGAANLGVALGSGLALMAAILAFGHISGGHFNPAVTLGAALAGRVSWADVLPYWVAQIFGAALVPVVLLMTIPEKLPGLLSSDGTGTRKSFIGAIANGYAENSPLQTASQGKVEFTLLAAFVIEAVLTAVLVAVFLGANDRRANRSAAPIAVGLAFTVLVLIAMPISNGALNPARALAAALFAPSWALSKLWLFWVAPLAGAAVAGLLYRAFAPATDDSEDFDDETNMYVVDEDLEMMRAPRTGQL
jgi:aquaporin Z